MTVILLDPRRPGVIPAQALTLLDADSVITEDVPPTVQWSLPSRRIAVHNDQAGVIITSDPDHPEVRRRIAAGEQVVAVPSRPGEEILEAVDTVARARAHGPWEGAQTHASLLPYLIEETWELVDAVSVGDTEEIRGELGDLLLQVLFHAEIAATGEASGRFTIDDVAHSLHTKLARRMPFLVGGAPVPRSVEEQDRIWRERKAGENRSRSVVAGISRNLPALALLDTALQRLLATGFPLDLLPDSIRRIDVEAVWCGRAEAAGSAEPAPAEAVDVGDGYRPPPAAPGVDEVFSLEAATRGNVMRFLKHVELAEAAERARVEGARERFDGMDEQAWRRQWPRRSVLVEAGAQPSGPPAAGGGPNEVDETVAPGLADEAGEADEGSARSGSVDFGPAQAPSAPMS